MERKWVCCPFCPLFTLSLLTQCLTLLVVITATKKTVTGEYTFKVLTLSSVTKHVGSFSFIFVLLCCPWSVYLVTRLMSRCRFSVSCRSVLRHDVTSGRHRHPTPAGATHTSTDDVTANSTSKKYRVTWRKTPGDAQWRLARPRWLP